MLIWKTFVCGVEHDNLNISVGIPFHSNSENFDRSIQNSDIQIRSWFVKSPTGWRNKWICEIIRIYFSSLFRSFTNFITWKSNILPCHGYVSWQLGQFWNFIFNFESIVYDCYIIVIVLSMSKQLMDMKWRWNCQSVDVDFCSSRDRRMIC
jgi:hypothetical protein